MVPESPMPSKNMRYRCCKAANLSSFVSDPKSQAVGFALQFGQHQGHCFGCAGSGRNHGKGGSSVLGKLLFGKVQQALSIIKVSVK